VAEIVETAIDLGGFPASGPCHLPTSNRLFRVTIPDDHRTVFIALFSIKAVSLGGENKMIRQRIVELSAPLHERVECITEFAEML